MLGRRMAPVSGDRVTPLPEYRYDPFVGANVVADGRVLVEAVDPVIVANYTSTQDQGGVRRKDDQVVRRADARVIVVAAEDDFTADLVVRRLDRDTFVRLDPGRLREGVTVTGRFAAGWSCVQRQPQGFGRGGPRRPHAGGDRHGGGGA
ncbi:hypothetical protein [Embleya scabrispora]|uniref:hypothetical protein n=1 Tax=Embleya scabrispora TaxID=159449 RepID=UPI0003A3197A|nr:hypothetical protein [Embleya scabrispora]